MYLLQFCETFTRNRLCENKFLEVVRYLLYKIVLCSRIMSCIQSELWDDGETETGLGTNIFSAGHPAGRRVVDRAQPRAGRSGQGGRGGKQLFEYYSFAPINSNF